MPPVCRWDCRELVVVSVKNQRKIAVRLSLQVSLPAKLLFFAQFVKMRVQ